MINRTLRKMLGTAAPKRAENDALRGVNAYWRQLTTEEITAGEHRGFVGGLWERDRQPTDRVSQS